MHARDTGIEIIGAAPWGTHFCQFYTTKQDLLDILLPYFEAGLRHNEACMWVTCDPLTCDEARDALIARYPEARACLDTGQMEIVPHDRWYVIDGQFDLHRVLDGWVAKLQAGLARGHEGLRVTGNTAWLEDADWASFADYEAAINSVIGQHQMMALCTYSLELCGASEIMDVIKNHEFALMKRHAQWEIVESQQRRTTTLALRRSEELYRSLFEHSLNALALHEIVTDEAGVPIDCVFLQVNRAFEQQTGLSAQQVVGRRVREVLPGIEHTRFIDTYGRVALTGEPAHFEEFAPQLGRHYEICAFRPAPRQFAVTFLDITHRKAAEKALRDQATALSEANRLKDEFLTTLSHELRTPLNAILGWAQLLGEETLGRETMRRGLDTIERNARAQKALIEEILDASRMITGKTRLEMKPVALADVVAHAVDVVRPAAQAKRIEIIVDLQVRPQVAGDPARLQQILWNLLSNAVKFTPSRGSIRVGMRRVDSKVQLTVQDTGAGIAPDFLPHIFERFTQADGTTTRQYGGLGLGLAIARHLAELHGGEVGAESAGEGRGATFTVTLPIRAVVEAAEAPPGAAHEAAVAPSAGIRLDGARVMVVDDEADDRELVAMVVGRAGAEVCTAGSVAEAMSRLEEFAPDVLVTDIGMPGHDGYELLRRAHASGPSYAALRAVALTAYGRSEDRARALAAGFDHYLVKPVTPGELVAAIGGLRKVSGAT
jgi:PAS domain S-box-containing protein